MADKKPVLILMLIHEPGVHAYILPILQVSVRMGKMF